MQTVDPDKIKNCERLARTTDHRVPGWLGTLLAGAFKMIGVQAIEIADLRQRVVALEKGASHI